MTSREHALESARRLVAERFPDATAAWLSGSVVLGGATSTSDLDITVLQASGGAHRESLQYDGWPVELFVHTADSVRHYVAKDRDRRRPTMARLVSGGEMLLDVDGSGAALVAECTAAVAAGPPALEGSALELARYGLTDLLDDLVGGGPPAIMAAVAVEVWREATELLLAVEGRWSGTGKWLVRELEAHDAVAGSTYAPRLLAALRAALDGDPGPLVVVADEVLDLAGGRLWAGFRLGGDAPVSPASPRSGG
ncbi:hypothetical protein FB382_004259 [Nocardioides ginsengisegetis]|uniref:Nucleotidyltransferase domain-containing protein n=1 Tax=Nocardioides ginsengisegetis TaxID=661491 RepID=A0A7W3J4B9_9ACTN|nr:nucleotidyltransferase domain-containing protein [Nocardioides ginsengisegetis]MBA8805914.1 hypothetical protein [Nocardioides ginsengisegetis]